MVTKFRRSIPMALAATVATGLIFCAGNIFAADWVRKTTSNDWTWFEDYVYAWATYLVACEPGRTCQVGMGVFTLGAPRGEKITFSGEKEILVIGIGSLHIRPADDQGPVKAAIAPKEEGLINIHWDF